MNFAMKSTHSCRQAWWFHMQTHIYSAAFAVYENVAFLY